MLRGTLALAEDYKRDAEENGLRNATDQDWAAPLPREFAMSSYSISMDSASVSDKWKKAEPAHNLVASGPSGNGMSLESRSRDSSYSDVSSIVETGRDEIPMDFGPDGGLTHKVLAEFIEVDPIDKCRGYLGVE